MAEANRHAKPAGGQQRIIDLVGDHRTNDLVYGHVGRLNYILPDRKDKQHGSFDHGSSPVGKLYANRSTGSTSFQEVLPLTTWYPASKSGFVKNEQSDRLHMAWLLKNAPEALVGTAGPSNWLSEEITACRPMKPFQARLPLLAYGAIADARRRSLSACPALAMAAGDSGHILRIMRVRDSEVCWPELDGGLSIRLADADATEEGHWCSRGPPISQIKFAAPSHASTGTSERWLLVQTSTATTVFEPKLLKTPQSDHGVCGYVPTGPALIAANPIVTIVMEQTGGRPHSDVAFHSGLDNRPAQLAIIDEGGSWSVWYMESSESENKSESVRKPSMVPRIRARGNFLDGMPKVLSMARASGLGYLHRIAWLSGRSKAAVVAGGSSGDPGLPTSSTTDGSDVLLLSNASVLRIFNAAAEGHVCTLNPTHRNGLDAILDIQPCPTRPSRVFVLTTTAVFWLDLGRIRTSTRSPSRQKNKTPDPVVLISCPHLRDASDKGLKLSIASSSSSSSSSSSEDGQTWTVLVYSISHPEVTTISLSAPAFGKPASCQRQLLRLQPPTAAVGGQSRKGEQALLVFPRAASSDADGGFADNVHFFQFVVLGKNLDLLSALWASSPLLGPGMAAPVLPEAGRSRQRAWQNKVILDFLHNSFVVPDGFDERSLLPKPMLDTQSPAGIGFEAVPPPPPLPATRGVLSICDLSEVFKLVNRRMDTAAANARRATDLVGGFQKPLLLDMVRGIIEAGLEIGSFPFSTLLDIVDGKFATNFPAGLSDLKWARQLGDLGSAIEERRVCVFDQMQEGANFGLGHGYGHHADTLCQAMTELCISDSMQYEMGDESAAALDYRRGLVEYASVQLFFSQISIVVVPPEEEAPEGGDDKRSAQSATTMTKPSRPAPTPYLLSSSPPQVAAWLASSQDEGREAGEIDSRVGGEDDGQAGGEADEYEDEDETIARLRLYARSIGTGRRRDNDDGGGGELRLLSHWQLGSDPSQFLWVPASGGAAMEEQRREEEEERARRRKRNEKKATRELEQLRLRRMRLGGVSIGSGSGFGDRDTGGSGSGLDSFSSPAVPRIVHSSSQLEPPAIRSSQMASSQMMSSQVPLSSQAMASPLMSSQPMSSQVFSSQVGSSQGMPSRAFGSGLPSRRPKKHKKVARAFR